MTDAVRTSGAGALSAWPRTPWFLTTPPEPRDTIARPRVTGLLDAALAASSVVAVGAPSGYGKTTAAAQWARAAAGPVAWLSLTRFDRTDDRIANGIVAAVRRGVGDPQALAQLAASAVDVHDSAAVADVLATVLSRLAGGLTLVIDQVEFAETLETSAIAALAAKCPPNLRLILLATRAADDLLRAAGADGATLSAEDLAFDTAEIRAAAASVSDTALTDDTADAIRERTTGWPLAVQLHLRATAPIDLSGRPRTDLDAGRPAELDDYVETVILAALPPALAELIRATTITPSFDDALAKALLPDDPDVAAHLDECVRQGLFLDRFSDGGRRVYVWHATFREAVVAAESHRHPERTTARHLRVAQAQRDTDPLSAIEHFIAAPDPGLAYDVVLDTWLELVQEGHARALDGLCAILPDEWADRPAMLAVRACCAWLAGDMTGARLHMRRGAATTGDTPRERAVFDIAGLLTTDDPAALREFTGRTADALNDPAAIGSRLAAHVLFVLGYTALRLRRGAIDDIATLRSAMREAELRRKPRLAARVAGTLSFALAFEGQFTEALALAERSVPLDQDDEWQVYDGGSAACTFGFVAYWRDELTEAREAFAEVRRLAIGATAYEPVALMYDALSAAASGDLAWQTDAFERLRGMPSHTVLGVPWGGFRDSALAKLACARGRVDDAVRYARRLIDTDDYLPVPRAIAAEILRRAGETAAARDLVAATPMAPLTVPARVRLMLTDALLRHDAGRTDAHVVLERCLDLAAGERILRPFADPLPELQSLLQTHATWGTRHGAFIAEALNRSDHGDQAAELSVREREVLAYLRTPMTIAEIASELFLSTNTVKTHVQSLYRKLNVTSRREAVQLRV